MTDTDQTQEAIVLGPGQRGWRAAKPTCPCEAEALYAMAESIDPDGIDVPRFGAWLRALLTDRAVPGAPRSSRTLPKYRRFLVELHKELDVDHEPQVHRCGDLVGAATAPDGADREPESESAQNPRFRRSVNLAAAA